MISVHAISILYELRALRSRLSELADYQDLYAPARTTETLSWAVNLTDNIIRKVERVDAVLLEAQREAETYRAFAAEAGLGAHDLDGSGRDRSDGQQ